MWSTNLHVKICRWGKRKKSPPLELKLAHRTQGIFCSRSEIFYFLHQLILRSEILISDPDKNLQISDLKFGSEMENIRSEITLENKISDLRNPLLNGNLCI